jgi:uncharacterized protein YndB with AHSA1/START domain
MGSTANRTVVERRSDRELVVTRSFNAPARIVWGAWTKPELLKRWWAPRARGVSLYECEMDIRVGGKYRYVFGRDPKQSMAFSGTFTEVVLNSRLVRDVRAARRASGLAPVSCPHTFMAPST